MSLETRKVHEFAKVPTETGSAQWRLVRTNPILRVARQGGDGNTAVVLIQKGTAYSEGGQKIAAKDLPVWFTEEIEKCSAAALAECGWKVPAAKGN